MNQQLNEITGRQRKGRILHASLKIDMTPMVDLGFLLITFFIFTTEIGGRKALNLIMPKEGPPSFDKESQALTAVLGAGNKVYVYEGIFESALQKHAIITTSYNEYKGLGNIIRNKQKMLSKSGASGKLLLLIKPLTGCTYENIIEALDEASINNVNRYAIVDPEKQEKIRFQ